jgi:hypothetical protein
LHEIKTQWLFVDIWYYAYQGTTVCKIKIILHKPVLLSCVCMLLALESIRSIWTALVA